MTISAIGARLADVARLIRLEYAGATYHVIGQGLESKAICGRNEDRWVWWEKVARPWVGEWLRMGDLTRVTQAY